MKKEMILISVSFFIMSFCAITVVNADEENRKVTTISKREADITGDGKTDTIYLKGIPYHNHDSYFKKIFIEVFASDDRGYKFPLESGSRAKFKFADLNSDGVKDIFSSVQTGGSGGISIHFIDTLKDFVPISIPVPEPLEMDSKFLAGYKAEIIIKRTGKRYIFDLKERKKDYKKLGLYYKGKLNEPTELTVNPFTSLKPVLLDGGKIGLKGLQRVTGIANADTIASVESTWHYQGIKWKLVRVQVKKINKH